MRADWLDLALIVMAAAFAVSGYRQGFIVGSLSFLGFLSGAILGAEFGPGISRALVGGQTQQDVVAVILLVSGAIIGQFVASSIGTAVRQTMTGRSTTQVDAAGGAAVSVLSVLLIAWAIGSVMTASPFPVVVTQVNNSAVLRTMDRVVPSPARTMFSDFRRLLASGPFPQVFSGIGEAHLLNVPAPDPAVLHAPGTEAARRSIVKILGVAPSCSKEIEGSGFVYAPQHVITNAHVVAGVSQRQTVTTANGVRFNATVVFYDPQIDIAVLNVPGLNLPSLRFDTKANPGDNAVVAGYPENHPLTAVAARIAQVQRAQGPDIYQTGQVERQIYQIRALVEEGNSGGPLLSSGGTVYGMVFAAAVGVNDTGFALTSTEVLPDANAASTATAPVSTQSCTGSLGQGQQQVGVGNGGQALAVDPGREVIDHREDPGHRDPVGRPAVAAHPVGAATEQGDSAPGITTAGMGDADSDLGEALPEVALCHGTCFPQHLEHLVGVEGLVVVDEALGEGDGFGGGQYKVVGYAGGSRSGVGP